MCAKARMRGATWGEDAVSACPTSGALDRWIQPCSTSFASLRTESAWLLARARAKHARVSAGARRDGARAYAAASPASPQHVAGLAGECGALFGTVFPCCACAHACPRSLDSPRVQHVHMERSKHTYTPATRSEARSDSSSQLPTERCAPDASRGRWGVSHSRGPAIYVFPGGRAWNTAPGITSRRERAGHRWQNKGRPQQQTGEGGIVQ